MWRAVFICTQMRRCPFCSPNPKGSFYLLLGGPPSKNVNRGGGQSWGYKRRDAEERCVCHGQLQDLGDRAACATSGVLSTSALSFEHAVARVCRAKVACSHFDASHALCSSCPRPFLRQASVGSWDASGAPGGTSPRRAANKPTRWADITGPVRPREVLDVVTSSIQDRAGVASNLGKTRVYNHGPA